MSCTDAATLSEGFRSRTIVGIAQGTPRREGNTHGGAAMAEASAQPQLLSRDAGPQDTLLRCDSDLVGVLLQPHHRRLVALRDISE